jgi:hypothetical protein
MGMRSWAAAGALALAAFSASSALGANLVVNGDFSAGATGFSTGYGLTTMTPYLFQNGAHGIYAVEAIGDVAASSQYGDWTNVTKDPSGGNGNVYVADGATDPNVTVWSQTVNVKANSDYTFSFYAAEISNACCSNANLVPTIDGDSGAGLAATGAWRQGSFIWNSGANTKAVLSLLDTNTSGGFNDFVLTDIALDGAAPGVPEPATWASMVLGFGLAGEDAHGEARPAGPIGPERVGAPLGLQRFDRPAERPQVQGNAVDEQDPYAIGAHEDRQRGQGLEAGRGVHDRMKHRVAA